MKILLMGSLSPPYTGQSIAFTTIVNQLPENQKIVINISNKNGILSGIVLCLKIVFIVLFKTIDVIYFTCSRSFSGSIRDIVLLLCARVKKIRVVNHLHGNTFCRFYHTIPHWYRPIVKYAYDWVDTSIVLLPAMATQFKDFSRMKIVSVANSYSSELDVLPLEKDKSDSNVIRLLYMSNIMESKGIIHLLKACELLFQTNPNLSLSIAGTFMNDGICSETKIKEKFDLLYYPLKENYPNQLDYKGQIVGEEKVELLWQSDVFILPTFYTPEAFPLSILESMRAGNYILSTTHNYISDIVTEQNGDLIIPDSADAIVHAVNSICLNIIRLNTVQNYNIQYAIKNYTEEKYVERVLSIINS